MNRHPKIALVAGGYSNEYEVSLKSREGILHFLEGAPLEIYPVLITHEKWVVQLEGKEYPINLKLITAGMAFRIKLITENGGSQCHNSTLISWIRRVRPLNPPGISPPVRTKLFKFTAMIKDPARIRQVRRRVSLMLFFVILTSIPQTIPSVRGIVSYIFPISSFTEFSSVSSNVICEGSSSSHSFLLPPRL